MRALLLAFLARTSSLLLRIDGNVACDSGNHCPLLATAAGPSLATAAPLPVMGARGLAGTALLCVVVGPRPVSRAQAAALLAAFLPHQARLRSRGQAAAAALGVIPWSQAVRQPHCPGAGQGPNTGAVGHVGGEGVTGDPAPFWDPRKLSPVLDYFVTCLILVGVRQSPSERGRESLQGHSM